MCKAKRKKALPLGGFLIPVKSRGANASLKMDDSTDFSTGISRGTVRERAIKGTLALIGFQHFDFLSQLCQLGLEAFNRTVHGEAMPPLSAWPERA